MHVCIGAEFNEHRKCINSSNIWPLGLTYKEGTEIGGSPPPLQLPNVWLTAAPRSRSAAPAFARLTPMCLNDPLVPFEGGALAAAATMVILVDHLELIPPSIALHDNLGSRTKNLVPGCSFRGEVV